MRGPATISVILGVTLGTFPGCDGDDAGAPAETVPPDASPVEVTAVTLGRAAAAGVAPTEVFAPEDEVVARVETRGEADRGTLVVDWETADGERIGESSRSIEPGGRRVTEFRLAPPGGWAEGRYRLEVWLNGRRVVSRPFRVEPGG